jgi:hypothetical protein
VRGSGGDGLYRRSWCCRLPEPPEGLG